MPAQGLVVVDKLSRGPGRPRRFDLDTALSLGQSMFHAHGYENVGLAALTEAMGIKPPSFYKAFGSKAEFFGRILERYSRSVLALDDILRPGRPVTKALAALLALAAHTYARDPQQLGCLVLEAIRGSEPESVNLARQTAAERRDQIHAFVAATHPEAAQAVTDYIVSTMSGLSASAREGVTEPRLLAVAHMAATSVTMLLASTSR